MRHTAGSVSIHCRCFRCNLVGIFIFGWRNSSRHFDWSSDAEPASDETEKSQKNEILTKLKNTMKKKFTFLIAALMLLTMVSQPTRLWGQQQTYDFTSTNNFYTDSNLSTHPSTGNSNLVTTFYYSNGNTFVAADGKAYFNSGYFLYGKSGASLTLPTFSFAVKKIVVDGNGTSASASVVQNIYVGSTAVSTSTTGAQNNNTYVIDANYQTAGTAYKLKVGSNHNSQLTAIKIYQAFTVAYNAGTGSGTMADNNTYAQGDEVSLLANSFTAPGANYTFSSWLVKDADNNTLTVTNNKFTMPASNVTVTAQWVSSGPTPLATPTNFSATPGNEQASFSWDAVANASSYTISYTPEGGAEQTVSGITGTSRTITGLTNDKAYTCKIKAVGDGTSYSDSEYSSTISVTPTGATFYTVTIADGIENGTVEASPTSATQGTQISLTANPSAGCGFTSWNVYKTGDPNTTVTVTDNKFNMPEYNVTVSATFTPYSVTLNAGTGSVASPTWNVTMNEGNLPAASPSATCTEDGWTFYGWSTAAVNETTTAPTTMVQTAYVPTGNTTLYAVYKEGQAAFDNTASGNWTIYVSITTNEKTTTTYYAAGNVNSSDQLAPTTNSSEATIYAFEKLSGVGIGDHAFAIKNGNNYIASSDKKLINSENSYTWNISEGTNGSWRITASDNTARGLIFRAGTSNVFKNYATSNVTSTSTEYFDVEIGVASPITYNSNPECLEKVATPNITLAAGTYTSVQTTKITCETEGATIYYTTDGNAPTTSSTQYVANSDIEINTSMTIKAIAVADGMANSEIASKDYVINLPLTTMDEIFAKASENSGAQKAVTIVFNNWVISGASNRYAFVTDGTKGFALYDSENGLNFSANQKLNGTVACNLELSNGYARVSGVNTTTSGLTVTNDGSVSVANIALADLVGVNTGALVHYDNLTCSTSTNGNNTYYYLSDGITSIQVYTTLNNQWTLEANHKYNITGVYQQYNSNKEILPRSEGDVVEVAKYNVTYWKNDGTQTKETASYYTGTTVTVAAADLFEAPDCQSFSEWNTNADGDGTQYNPGYQFIISANLELYARWAENSSFTVTYNVNGSTTAIAAATVDCGETVTLPSASLEPLSFLGWATTEDGAVAYKAGASYGPTANVTLYAVFGSMESDNLTIDLSTSGITSNSYGSGSFTTNSKSIAYSNVCKQTSGSDAFLQFKGSSGAVYNAADNSLGTITSIVINYYSGTENYGLSVKGGNEKDPSSGTSITGSGDGDEKTFSFSGYSFGYFGIYCTGGYSRVNSIVVYYNQSSPVTIINISNTPAEPTTSIPANSCIVVHDGGVLTFTGSNNDASKLIVQDGGQLKVTSTGSKDAVQATVQKDIIGYGTGTSDKWNFIASPITTNMSPTAVTNLLGEKIGDDPVTYNYDLYRLNNTTWENYHQHNANADPFMLVNSKGYLYAKQSSTTLSFAGTIKPYDANYEIPVSEGWNLIGNPYTFDAYSNVAYYAMNAEGTGITANTVTTSTAVKPCTGIIIKAAGDGNVKFLDEAPVGSANNSNLQITLAHNVTSRDGASVNSTLDNAIVSFNEGTRLEKFYFGEPAANIFIPQNDEDYAIAFSDRQGDMPLNFKANELGTYTISFAGEEMDLNGIYLIDILAQEEIDLSVNPSYTFIGSPADSQARFIIRFDGSENSEVSENSDIFAYQSGNDIIVSGEGELQIFDVMGRMVMTQHVSGVETVRKPSQGGVYIFKLNEKTQKIVVR